MKKIYLGLFIILFTSNIRAQLFEEITGTPFDGVYLSSIAFADIDNDGDQDVLITGAPTLTPVSPIAKLYTNDGNGFYTEVIGTPFDGVWQSSIAFADIDNDNDQDVLITGTYTSNESVSLLYTNDGNGNFTEVFDTPIDGVRSGSIAFADIDNDNDQDLLITGDSSLWNSVSILYTNDGNGNFTEVSDTPFDGVINGSIAFADIDNDGDQDVLITGGINFVDYVAKLYTNDGNGNFEEVVETPFEGVTYSSIAFADTDNDNDQDVLITGYSWYSNEITALHINDGNGNFSPNSFDFYWNYEVAHASLAFSDIDNDNDQDVLIIGLNGSSNKQIYLFTNDGNSAFSADLDNTFDGGIHGSIAFADIDNDGDQDLLITGYNESYPTSGQPITKLYRNLEIVGVDEIDLFNQVSISPNPNTGLVNIDLGSLKDVSIKVINLSGQLIYYKENINTPIYQFELDAASGIYILELSAGGEKQQFKLVKQ